MIQLNKDNITEVIVFSSNFLWSSGSTYSVKLTHDLTNDVKTTGLYVTATSSQYTQFQIKDVPTGASYSLGEVTFDKFGFYNLEVVEQTLGVQWSERAQIFNVTEETIVYDDFNEPSYVVYQEGGPQGSTGSQGLTGSQGSQGLTGSQGLQGFQGVQGLTGSQGLQGTGFQGVQGVQGLTGSQGVQGVQGLTGSQGIQGLQGVQGLTGSQGLQGVQGVQGLTGSQGLQGVQGTQGLTGSQGFQGLIGPQGFQGPESSGSFLPLVGGTLSGQLTLDDQVLQANNIVGDNLLIQFNGLYLTTPSTTFIFPVADGMNGDVLTTDGSGGLTFTQSSAGPQGVQGSQGLNGPQGLIGFQGPVNTFPGTVPGLTVSVDLRVYGDAYVGNGLYTNLLVGQNLQIANGFGPFTINNKGSIYIWPEGDGPNRSVMMTDGSGNLSFDPVTKLDIGLDQVDNTSDADKPLSTAVVTALNGKVNIPLFFTASTTNNALTNLTSILIPLNTNKSIRYHLKGRSTTTANRFAAECWFVMDNTGGVVTSLSTPSIDRKSTFTNAVQTSVTISGSSVNINITGPNGQTVVWELYVREIL